MEKTLQDRFLTAVIRVIARYQGECMPRNFWLGAPRLRSLRDFSSPEELDELLLEEVRRVLKEMMSGFLTFLKEVLAEMEEVPPDLEIFALIRNLKEIMESE